jgi:hypothetical protein
MAPSYSNESRCRWWSEPLKYSMPIYILLPLPHAHSHEDSTRHHCLPCCQERKFQINTLSCYIQHMKYMSSSGPINLIIHNMVQKNPNLDNVIRSSLQINRRVWINLVTFTKLNTQIVRISKNYLVYLYSIKLNLICIFNLNHKIFEDIIQLMNGYGRHL